MVCGQIQLACDDIDVRSGIVGGTGGSESLLIIPGSADDVVSRVEEILTRAKSRAGMPPFFVTFRAERPAFFVAAEEYQGIVPDEQDLQNVYWGGKRTPVDLDPTLQLKGDAPNEEDLLVPPGGWDSARFN